MERYEWTGYTGKECEVVWGDEDRPVGVIANDVDMVHELLRLAARVKELEDVVNEKDRIMAKTWELVTSSLDDCQFSSDPEPGQTLRHIFSEMVIDRRPLTDEERERAYWQMMEGGVFDELKKARNPLTEEQSVEPCKKSGGEE